MSSVVGLLVVDSLWLISVLVIGLFTTKKILIFTSCINTGFIPTKPGLINNLSPSRFKNCASVNFKFSDVSTRPTRAIIKYLNNLLLIKSEIKP